MCLAVGPCSLTSMLTQASTPLLQSDANCSKHDSVRMDFSAPVFGTCCRSASLQLTADACVRQLACQVCSCTSYFSLVAIPAGLVRTACLLCSCSPDVTRLNLMSRTNLRPATQGRVLDYRTLRSARPGSSLPHVVCQTRNGAPTTRKCLAYKPDEHKASDSVPHRNRTLLYRHAPDLVESSKTPNMLRERLAR